jgi:hypothetical protein
MSSSAWLNHLVQDRLHGHQAGFFRSGRGAARKFAKKLVFKPFKNICTDFHTVVDHYIVIFIFCILYIILFFSILVSF